jgi:hypothetical protein
MSLLLYGPEGTGKTFLAGAFLGSVEEVKRKGYATLNANVLLAEPTRMKLQASDPQVSNSCNLNPARGLKTDSRSAA